MRFLNSRGGRIRRISSDFMGYPKIFPSSRRPGGARGARDAGMRSGGPTVGPGGPGLGPGGARAGARGGHGPPGPPAGYGPVYPLTKSMLRIRKSVIIVTDLDIYGQTAFNLILSLQYIHPKYLS